MIRLIFLLVPYLLFAETDPLPSWNEGNAKKSIIEFVNDVTDPQNSNFVPEEDRIATFDQDGTLWVEQPMYTQLFYLIDRYKKLAAEHPEWKEDQLTNLDQLTTKDIEKLLARTDPGLTLDEYHSIVAEWLKKTVHPRFKRPFTELVYQPMLEVIELFKAHGFKTYIASGGGQEFMRSYAKSVYKISPEHIIGSAAKVKYEYRDGNPALVTTSDLLVIDDNEGKPETINLIIGKRPIAAFGNSDGDRQMLEWTKTAKGKRFALLVHHDDAEREYAYDNDSKIGRFSDLLMEEAKEKQWVVVSMKIDWKIMFPWQLKK